jgi:uncharacterized protein YkwD
MTFREWLLTLLDRWRPAPKPLPPPQPPPPPPPVKPTDFAARLLTLHNDYRKANGAGPLRLDARLTASAQRESDDCAKHRRLSHTSSDGASPFDRMTAAGYHWTTAGENIAEGQPTPEAACAAWESDIPHRDNMLNPQFVDVGFGLAHDSNGVAYWTADYGRPQ